MLDPDLILKLVSSSVFLIINNFPTLFLSGGELLSLTTCFILGISHHQSLSPLLFLSGGELLVPRSHVKSGHFGRRGSGDEASLRHGHLISRAAGRRGSGDVDLLRRSLAHKADSNGQ